MTLNPQPLLHLFSRRSACLLVSSWVNFSRRGLKANGGSFAFSGWEDRLGRLLFGGWRFVGVPLEAAPRKSCCGTDGSPASSKLTCGGRPAVLVNVLAPQRRRGIDACQTRRLGSPRVISFPVETGIDSRALSGRLPERATVEWTDARFTPTPISADGRSDRRSLFNLQATR